MTAQQESPWRRSQSDPLDPREGGGATVVMAAVIVVTLVLTVAVAGLIAAMSAAGRARTGADLAALGAAQALHSLTHPAPPCAVAKQIGQANGTQLSRCEVVGEDVVVTVTVPLRIAGLEHQAQASARAGPIP